MDEKERILYINLEGKVAGAEKSLLLLIRYLRDRYCIHLCCPGQSDLARQAAELGITCWDLPKGKVRSYRSLAWLTLWAKINWRVLRVIVKVRPRLIHANSIYAAAVTTLPALLTRRVLIWHVRDLTKVPLIVRLCGWFSTRVVAISQTVKDHLIRYGVSPRKLDVVYNGIGRESDCFRANLPARGGPKALGPGDHRVRVGTFANVGQFVPWKNQHVFLTVIAQVKDRLPGVKFWLVGDDLWGRNPAYKDRLFRQARDLSLSDCVVFTGWQEQMAKVWEQIDCVVHTAQGEPFGRVIIEAMDRGIPVIAMDCGGPGEIIKNEVTGLLVPPGDLRALGSAMVRVARDPGLVRALTANACQHVALNFTANRTADQIRHIYAGTLCR